MNLDPDEFVVLQIFRYLAGNQMGGSYYQMGLGGNGDFYYHAYACTRSLDVSGHAIAEDRVLAFKDISLHAWDPGDDRGTRDYLKNSCVGTKVRIVTKLSDLPVQEVSVVFLDLTERAQVYQALKHVEGALNKGSVIAVNKWWRLNCGAKQGFLDWANERAWLKDFDTHFELLLDNGWTRAYVVSSEETNTHQQTPHT